MVSLSEKVYAVSISVFSKGPDWLTICIQFTVKRNCHIDNSAAVLGPCTIMVAHTYIIINSPLKRNCHIDKWFTA